MNLTGNRQPETWNIAWQCVYRITNEIKINVIAFSIKSWFEASATQKVQKIN